MRALKKQVSMANRSFKKLVTLLFFTLAISSSFAKSKQAFIDYPSLLNTKFYEANGGLMIKNWPIFFAPENKSQLKIEVLFKNKPILSKTTYFESWSMPVVDGIKPKGSARAFMSKPGDYVLQVTNNGEAISQVAFSVSVEAGDDPFNPKKVFTRNGPWSKLAYLSSNPNRAKDGLSFNWWSRLSDLPSGQKGKVLIKLIKDGKEVAKTKNIHINKAIWQAHTKQFRTDANHIYTLAELTASDGKIEIVIESNGNPINSFNSVVEDGKLKAHPRSQLGYKPRIDFLPPKVIAKSSRKKIMVDAVWLDIKD